MRNIIVHSPLTSRFELAQYCLRTLGAPVIRINVTEDQIDDRINDALEMFLQYHFDGSYRDIIAFKLTEDDAKNRYITLPNTIMSVLGVYTTADSGSAGSNIGNNLQMQSYFSDLISRTSNNSTSGGNVASYASVQNYFGVMNSVLPTESGLTRVSSYRIYENKLKITSAFKWEKDNYIGIECYMFTDPDEVGKVFNDFWLKKYATALIKKQWGMNLTKFNGIALPGGGTLNGEQIFSQAEQEIQELELKLQNSYSYPIEPFMA